MAQFFIHRPVFAWVLALIVMLAGAFGLSTLPVSQYPDIAPTTVRISASYPGASATIVENSVTIPIEDGLTGLDGLTYMTASTSAGSASLSLVFDDSVDPDLAQVQVQNKLQLVQSSLPSSVQSQGLSVTRSTSSILLVGALVASDDRYTSVELGDVLTNTLEDPIKRTAGVGSINSFSSGYAMRIWLDPDKLFQYQLTPNDVTDAVTQQNTNVTVGSLGDLPAVRGQQMTVALSAQSQLRSIAEFENILLKTSSDGSTVYLGDVARIEIAAEDAGSSSRFNGKPAAGFGVNLANGANAVDTAAAVRATIDRLRPALPAGVEVQYAYDTSPFVQSSITKVYHTLFEAVVLVFLVILIFLQNLRATLIPALAVPVVLLGTFGLLAALGMTINTLTLFAVVIAIGLLVDDAIVVVENVERILDEKPEGEEQVDPVTATERSMGEISGALVGIVAVLSAVFLPMAFLGGSTGVIYRQFSITIIAAMVLSLLVALILTPALCAQLLKPRSSHQREPRWAAGFNRALSKLTGGYDGVLARLLKRPARPLLLLVVIAAAMVWGYQRLPSTFIPTEDQGVLMTMIQLPDSATAAQTEATVQALEQYVLNEEQATVASVFAALGFGFGGSGQNSAMAFIRLKEYAERPGLTAAALADRINQRFMDQRLGQVIAMQPPAIPRMGNTAGFSFYLVDQGGHGDSALASAANQLVAIANNDTRVTSLRGNESAVQPSLALLLDSQKASAFGVSLAEVNSMLSTIFAGSYVNDFILNNRLREVIVQGDAPTRMQPEDINLWSIRNEDGDMVPFGAIVSQQWTTEASKLARYGGTRALEISGANASGVSSGDAMAAMETHVADLDGGYGVAWTGLSYQEQLAGDQEVWLFSLSALVVFLCLAALYESWSVPFAVMLAVPVGILGALAAALLFEQSNDVYFKVGLLATIGLAARNAILIVEFAETLQQQGMSLLDATRAAARQRLRPILMTTFAFMLGILPLAIATGAGAAAQHSVGIGILGGVLFSTLFGIVLAPVFYAAICTLFRRTPPTLRAEQPS